MSPAGANQGLLRSPTNLKEAIDWILRVTNKDDCLCPLSQAVVTVLRDVQVKEYIGNRSRDSTVNGALDSSDEEWNLVKDILDSIETIGGVRTTRKLIEEVAEGLRKFVGYTEDENGQKTIKMGDKGIGCPGKNGGSSGVKACSHNGGNCEGYKSSYNGKEASISAINNGKPGAAAGSDSGKDSWTILAKIFLGAIPFVFSGLSYMYWLCSGSGAGREGFKKTDTVNSPDQVICHYLKRMGFETTNGLRSGMKVSELKEAIKNSKILTEGAESSLEQSFAMYLEAVRSKVSPTPPTTGGKTTDKEHSLLKLNILCTGYFRALNQPYRVHQRKHRLPRTIREILYWLSCVQYCPVFRVLVQKMQELCRMNGEGPKGEITFYAQKNDKIQTCLITPQNSVSYFLSAALVAPMVLLSIQDTIESKVGNAKRLAGKETEKEKTEALTDASTATQKATNEMTYEQKIEKILQTGGNAVHIHDLYSNSLFEFRFPMSETQSYYLLQDCLVALYYQLYFLRLQCNWTRQSNGADGTGWGHCRYGDGVNSDQCGSWICPVGDKDQHDYGKNQNGSNNKCGTSNPSPLQAFLTDCLKGFTCGEVMEGEYKDKDGKEKKDYQKNLDKLRKDGDKDNKIYSDCYPEFLEHRGHCPPGQYCPIPMGFRECFRKKEGSDTETAAAGNGIGMSGLGINAIAAHYANDDLRDSCLYQLVRCICSLTRRVPRSTGTLYGFFQGIISVYGSGQGPKGGGATEFKEALLGELAKETFGLQGSVTLMKALEEWKTKTGTHSTSGSCCSLDSLSGCEEGSKAQSDTSTCGKYLHPLSGSLYNSVATQYTDTYLSWIIHLSARLQSGLKELLVEFTRISCEHCKQFDGKSGKLSDKQCECHATCKNGNHGTAKDKCKCHSVFHCAGVYSVFYRFGFSYVSPFGLSGRKKEKETYDSDTRRQCHDFYKQLQNVITGDLFSDLLKQIRAFLYTTRAPFGLYVTAFWSIVLVYLLWSMTVNLDLVHIRSHWRSPRSYLVPVGTLLSNGSRKGFCTLGYFQEANGDRLLSEGISDLYL